MENKIEFYGKQIRNLLKTNTSKTGILKRRRKMKPRRSQKNGPKIAQS